MPIPKASRSRARSAVLALASIDEASDNADPYLLANVATSNTSDSSGGTGGGSKDNAARRSSSTTTDTADAGATSAVASTSGSSTITEGKLEPTKPTSAAKLFNGPVGVSIGFLHRFIQKHQAAPNFHDFTTHHVVHDIIIKETAQHKCAYVDYLPGKTDAKGAPYIGLATVYVSHAWKYLFADTIDVLEQYAREHPNTYFWMDVFVISQNAKATLSPEWHRPFMKAVKHIGCVLLVMSPWRDPVVVTRAWCLWEIVCALYQENVRLEVKLPRVQQQLLRAAMLDKPDALLQAIALNVRVQNAAATRDSDLSMIMHAVAATIGVDALNDKVTKQLRDVYMQVLRGIVAASSSTHEGTHMLGQMGTILLGLKMSDDAIAIHEKELALCLSGVGPTHPTTVNAYEHLAHAYMQKCVYDKAAQYYQSAVSVLSVAENTITSRLMYVYHQLGVACSNMGNHRGAITAFEGELRIRIAINARFNSNSGSRSGGSSGGSCGSSDGIVACYTHLGRAFDAVGEYVTAMECMDTALTHHLNVHGPDHAFTAAAYDNSATTCLHMGKVTEAIQYFEKSLAIKLALIGPTSSEVIGTYNSIAAAYFTKGDLVKSLKHFNTALQLSLDTYGPNNADAATAYNGIGVIYFKKGQLDEAIEYCDKGLAIRVAVLGELHPDTGVCYANIGNMYLQHHDLPRAQDSLEEALKVFNHTLGSAHPETASIHYIMALVFEQLHNTGKARDHVRACVDIRQKTLGNDHADTVLALELLQRYGGSRRPSKQSIASTSTINSGGSDKAATSAKEYVVAALLCPCMWPWYLWWGCHTNKKKH